MSEHLNFEVCKLTLIENYATPTLTMLKNLLSGMLLLGREIQQPLENSQSYPLIPTNLLGLSASDTKVALTPVVAKPVSSYRLMGV